MEQRSNVLVVEDDAGIRQSLIETLTALGFMIGEAGTGEEALLRLRMIDYDAVLLDINMSGMGGIEACRIISQNYPRLPVVMLTVRDEEDDKVEALDAGADDYVTKPFQIRELTARLRAAIRRSKASEVPSDSPIVIGSLVLDPGRRRVEKMGQEIHLTPKEFEYAALSDGTCRSPCASQSSADLHMGTGVWQRTRISARSYQPASKEDRRRSRAPHIYPDGELYWLSLPRSLESTVTVSLSS